jgi:membrane-bound serine protease (ClpP class)
MVQNMGSGLFDYDLTNLIKAFFIVVIAFFLAIVGSIILTKQLFGTSNFGKLALAKTQEATEGYTSASSSYQNMLQREGHARTILRPAGKVTIAGEQYDATALTGFIERGEEIIVVGYQTGQLVVKKK